MSSDFGEPLYSISPEPVTLAFRSPLHTISTSPEPVTLASTSSASKLKPWKSPEPVTLAFKFFVLPFKVKSPEPVTEASIAFASISKTMSPEPDTLEVKLLEIILSLFITSPDPERLTYSISSKGIVMVMVLYNSVLN